MAKLLTREQFREQVLSRNKGYCVVFGCPEKAVDAHHILNRRLFKGEGEQGGYFYENGAGLCSEHHYEAELTLITVKELYHFSNIWAKQIPAHFNKTYEYDTWGNRILSPHQRLQGELFEDEGCRKALKKAKVLWQFP